MPDTDGARVPEAWVGVAEVVPRPGNTRFGDGAGAFVFAVAYCASPDEFLKVVGAELESYDVDVIKVVDVEALGSRAEENEVADWVIEIAPQLNEERPVALGPFHAFPEDEGEVSK
jgi:hypothetical protein